MDTEDDGRIQSLEQLVEELRTGYNELLESTEKTIDRFEHENSELKREIASLKEKLENKDSEKEEEDESGEPDFPESEDIEDSKNQDPDDYITTSIPTGGTAPNPADRQSSLEWSPEYHATLQLHEFDDAPSVGRIHLAASGTSSSSGQSVTLKLVDPDGHTAEEDTSAKWMVPLRQADGSGKVLHWARIGNEVTFDVGSQPCPPELSGSGTSSGYVITLQNYVRSGSGCVSGTSTSVTIPIFDCDDVVACLSGVSGVTKQVVTSGFISGGNLYLLTEKVTALAWSDPSAIQIQGTSCESGGAS